MAAETDCRLVSAVKVTAAGDKKTVFLSNLHVIGRCLHIVIGGKCLDSVDFAKEHTLQQFGFAAGEILTGVGQDADSSGIVDQRYGVGKGNVVDRYIGGLTF